MRPWLFCACAAVGLVVGIALTNPVPHRYVFVEVFALCDNSRDEIHLAVVVRSLHLPGVRIRVHDAHGFQVAGHGSTAQAAVKAVSPVRNAIDRIPHHPRYSVLIGGVDALMRDQGYPLQPGAIGLACGVAIGMLIGIGQGLWSNQLRPRSARLRRSASGYRSSGAGLPSSASGCEIPGAGPRWHRG
jgi:hypothetical protein